MDKIDKTGICLVVQSLEAPVLRLEVMSSLKWEQADDKGETLKLTSSARPVERILVVRWAFVKLRREFLLDYCALLSLFWTLAYSDL